MSEAKSKYKMFRNFMANELGITRSDIEEWTKEAVREVAKKQVGQIDIHGIAKRAAFEDVYKLRNATAEAVGREIVSKMSLRFNIDDGGGS